MKCIGLRLEMCPPFDLVWADPYRGMGKIRFVAVGSYLQGFINPNWCKILSTVGPNLPPSSREFGCQATRTLLRVYDAAELEFQDVRAPMAAWLEMHCVLHLSTADTRGTPTHHPTGDDLCWPHADFQEHPTQFDPFLSAVVVLREHLVRTLQLKVSFTIGHPLRIVAVVPSLKGFHNFGNLPGPFWLTTFGISGKWDCNVEGVVEHLAKSGN